MGISGYRTNPLHHLYKTARWQRLRLNQLSAHPYCAMCQPRIVVATVCDHVTPHRGDVLRFWTGPFQSLCASCHNSTKQSVEKLGYGRGLDADGWPTDPSHPANRAS